MDLAKVIRNILLCCSIASAPVFCLADNGSNWKELSAKYEAEGDYRKAYEYEKLHEQYRDSIFTEQTRSQMGIFFNSVKKDDLEAEVTSAREYQSDMLLKALSAERAGLRLKHEQDSLNIRNTEAEYQHQLSILQMEERDRMIKEAESETIEEQERYSKIVGGSIFAILFIAGLLLLVVIHFMKSRLNSIRIQKEKAEEDLSNARKDEKIQDNAISYMNRTLGRPAEDIVFFSRTLNGEEELSPQLRQSLMGRLRSAVTDLIGSVSESMNESKNNAAIAILFCLGLSFAGTASAQNVDYSLLEPDIAAYYRRCDAIVSEPSVVSMCDTLFMMAENHRNDYAKVLGYNILIGNAYLSKDYDRMQKVSSDAISFIRATPYTDFIFHVRNRLVLYHLRNQNYTEAMNEARIYQNEALRYNSNYGISRGFYYTGEILRFRFLYPEALEQYQRGLSYLLSMEETNNDSIVMLYSSIGELMMEINDLEKAEEPLLKALEYSLSSYQEASVRIRLLRFYSLDGNAQAATENKHILEEYEQTDRLIDSRKNEYTNACALYYSLLGEHDKALECINTLGNGYLETQERIYLGMGDYRNALRCLRLNMDRESDLRMQVTTTNILALQTDWQDKFMERITTAENARKNELQADMMRNEMQLAELRHQRDSLGMMARMMKVEQQIDSIKLVQKESDIHEEELQSQKLKAKQAKTIAIVVNILAFMMLAWGVFTIISYIMLRRKLDKEIESAGNAKAAADSAAEAKRQFIQHISHEIRTPLNSILGFNEIACAGISEGEEMENDRMMIEGSTQAFESMLEEIHDYSSILAGNVTPHQEQFSADELCTSLADEFKGKTKDGVILECRTGDVSVKTDRKLLETCIRMILQNACKFTEKGHIEICCSADAGNSVITVTDTGNGISEGFSPHIYESFSKEDPFIPGLGLGLTIAKYCADKLGGSIRHDSSYREGTRITVSVPLAGR